MGKKLNAKADFVVLFPVIQSMGLETVCGPLIDFLMAAGTQHEVGEETHPTVGDIGRPVHDANAVLKHRRTNVLYKQLPDLKNGSTPNNNSSNDSLIDIVSAVQGIQSVTIRQAEAARLLATARAAAPKAFPTAFGDPTSDMMCKATEVADHEHLPPMWLELAGRSSSQKPISIIKKNFQIEAERGRVLSPVPTGMTLFAVQNFMFVGSSEETTGTGILPLSFSARNGMSTRERARLLQDEQNFQDVIAMQ